MVNGNYPRALATLDDVPLHPAIDVGLPVIAEIRQTWVFNGTSIKTILFPGERLRPLDMWYFNLHKAWISG